MKQIELKNYRTIIELEAHKCFKLIKKPANCEVQDLIQEGYLQFFKSKKYYVEKNIGKPFKPFFRQCLINKLNEILIYSYRTHTTTHIDEYEPPSTKTIQPLTFAALIEKIKQLNIQEINIINIHINPTPEFQKMMKHRPRRAISNTADYLNLSWIEEVTARNHIKEVILV